MTGINQFVNWAADKARRSRSEDKRKSLIAAIKFVEEFKSTQPTNAPRRPSVSPPVTEALEAKCKAMWAKGSNMTQISAATEINQSTLHRILTGKTHEAPVSLDELKELVG